MLSTFSYIIYSYIKFLYQNCDCTNFLTLCSTPTSAVWLPPPLLDMTLLSDVIGHVLIAKSKGVFFSLIFYLQILSWYFFLLVFLTFQDVPSCLYHKLFFISFFSVFRNVVLLGTVLGPPTVTNTPLEWCIQHQYLKVYNDSPESCGLSPNSFIRFHPA